MNQSYFAALVAKEQPNEQDDIPRAIAEAIAFGSHLEVIVTIVMVVVFLASSLSWREKRTSAPLTATSKQDVVLASQDSINDRVQVAPAMHPSDRR